MSDIFDEIEEDLRADRARKLLQRYGGWLFGALLLVVAATGGFQLWKYQQAKQTARTAGAFIAAMGQADGPAGPGRQAALAEFTRLESSGNPGYRTLARFRAAAMQADTGNLAGALALYDAIAADTAVDPLLRDAATLEWAMHQIDTGPAPLIAARLAPLAAPGNPWHALAQEQQALLDLRQNNHAAAAEVLQRLAKDVTTPDAVRGRANGLLAQLGDTPGD